MIVARLTPNTTTTPIDWRAAAPAPPRMTSGSAPMTVAMEVVR